MTGKQTSPERPTTKPPIYSCEVIQTACRALEAAVDMCRGPHGLAPNEAALEYVSSAAECALRIIRDGLASQERAIKGES